MKLTVNVEQEEHRHIPQFLEQWVEVSASDLPRIYREAKTKFPQVETIILKVRTQ